MVRQVLLIRNVREASAFGMNRCDAALCASVVGAAFALALAAGAATRFRSAAFAWLMFGCEVAAFLLADALMFGEVLAWIGKLR